MAQQPDVATASHAIADALDDADGKSYRAARIVVEYWRINLLDALDHWSRHERVVSVIGYLVSAIIVFSILLFGKGIDEAIIQSLVLGLGFAATRNTRAARNVSRSA